MTTEKPTLIAVDWGTSNFRAFLLNHEGHILKTHFAKQGLLHISRGDFAAALQQQLGDYLQHNPQIPIVMCGMVGSRQGWVEVPYLLCPLVLTNLATGLKRVEGQYNVWIVPGLRINYPDGRVDVMRGEETQILGCLSAGGKANLFCLPGTHSKWAWVEDGKLLRFSTFMTGELFNLLFKQSILGKPVKRVYLNMQAFYQGLEWSERSENVLSQLFQVRTQMLAGNLPIDGIHSFLSGLLIGHELITALAENSVKGKNFSGEIAIVANHRVCELYAKAFEKYQLKAVVMDIEQVTVQGIFKIARQAGLV